LPHADEFYKREVVALPNGSRSFQTQDDQLSQRAAADRIEKAWGCRIVDFAPLDPVDWAIWFGDLTKFLGELKRRSHKLRDYPTVFLSYRKLQILRDWCQPEHRGLVFYEFLDGLYWIEACNIDLRHTAITGVKGERAYNNGRQEELMILVPIKNLRRIEEANPNVVAQEGGAEKKAGGGAEPSSDPDAWRRSAT
jgi:hypothetical protein